jgi:demethylmenaquinone methyltransferase/2-methoxy-6-polyprenyl-1,4-benzoquinol methylase
MERLSAGGHEGLLSKQPAQIARMFDTIARRYDTLNRLLSAGLDRRWRARAIDALRLSGNEPLLDLCTGTADVMLAALDRPGAPPRAVGIDFSSEMLRHARRKLDQHAGGRQAVLVRADATHLPLASSSMGAAAIAFGIRNVAQPERAARELYRVMRPGARLAIVELGVPRVPLIAPLYSWYFRRVLPRIGRVISHHADAYAYLPASVGTFPAPAEFCDLLRAEGFADVSAVPLTFGVVYLYTAVRR